MVSPARRQASSSHAARSPAALAALRCRFLKEFGAAEPPLFSDLPNCSSQPVCLVDHNQVSQMAEGINAKHLKGIIDHHAVQNGRAARSHPAPAPAAVPGPGHRTCRTKACAP